MTKALTAALAKRELMTRTGASPESIEVMNRRIAKLQPKGKEQPKGSEKGEAQEAEQPNGFDAALASFTAAAHRHLCPKCQHTARVLTEAGIEYEVV